MDASLPRTWWSRWRAWVVLAGLAIGLGLAYALAAPPGATQTERERTLGSLRQVDPYPLYTMRYYGDYGSAEALGGRPPWEEPLARSDGVEPFACTCFAALGEGAPPLYGRSFDWRTEPALFLYTDPSDGYASVSLVHGQRVLDDPLTAPWQPYDGMNDQGLVVGMMAVPAADAGPPAGRATLGSLTVIRVLLDYAASVEEALTILGGVHVSFAGGPPVHYLLADRGGDSALVEWVAGEMHVLRRDPAQAWHVAANYIVWGATDPAAEPSYGRFRRADQALAAAEGRLSSDAAMALLADVSQRSTVWSAVYDLTQGEARVVMGRQWEAAHTFRIDDGAE